MAKLKPRPVAPTVAPEPLVFRPHAGQQEKYFEATEHVDFILFGGGNGGGKGLPKHAKVLTPFGWKAIGDLKVGAKICATDGTVQSIIGHYDRGVQPAYKITFSDGTETVCDSDHIWLAWKCRGKRKIGNVETWGEDAARKYTTADIAAYYANPSSERMAIPVMSAPCAFNVAGENKGPYKHISRKIPPYVLGVLLGDGCITTRDTNFTSMDPEIPARVNALLGLTMTEVKSPSLASAYLIPRHVLADHLVDLGLLGRTSADKFIPRIYLLAPPEDRWELLRGLMDTDGWCEEDGDCYYTSISKKLADDVCHLARSMGAIVTWREKIPTFVYKGERKNGQLAYTLRIKMPDGERMFHLERKKARCRGRRYNSMGIYIDKIEPCEPIETVCIAVSNPNSLFVTDNFIVTHNTMSLLIDALLGTNYQDYEAAIFRRTLEQHKLPGGLWRESFKFYTKVPNSRPNKSTLTWLFDNDNKLIKLLGCEHEGDEVNYDGMQVSFLGFDQIEQFSAQQVFFIVSRLRSGSCEARRKIRATANPAPGWLADFLKAGGYVDGDGWPIPEMDGVIRYYIRDEKGSVVWRDSVEQFGDLLNTRKADGSPGPNILPTSFTFIKALIWDNPTLMTSDPRYLANLQQLPPFERRKRLEGNWNMMALGGDIFKGAWWGWDGQNMPREHKNIVANPPPRATYVRAWDIAWSDKADWITGILMCQDASGWYVVDAIRFRAQRAITISVIKKVAALDDELFGRVTIAIPYDPGAAGVEQMTWARELGSLGHLIRVKNDKEFGDKIDRCSYVAPQCEYGHVKLCRTHPTLHIIQELSVTEVVPNSGQFVEVDHLIRLGDWHKPLVEALDAFSDKCPHSVTDWTDPFSKAFNVLTRTDGAGAIQLAGEAGRPNTPEKRDLFKELNGVWGRPVGSSRRKGFLE